MAITQQDETNTQGDKTETHLCAVGLWTDITVRILSIPSLEEMQKEILEGGKDAFSYYLYF